MVISREILLVYIGGGELREDSIQVQKLPCAVVYTAADLLRDAAVTGSTVFL